MFMDTLFRVYPSSVNGFKNEHGSNPVCTNQNLVNGCVPSQDFVDLGPPLVQSSPPASVDSSPSPSSSWDGDHPDNNHFAHCVLKYINEMLMEEDLEGQTFMLQDCLALQAAEKSFYEVLGQKYPPSLNCCPHVVDQNDHNPDDNISGSRSVDGRDRYAAASNFVESKWIHGQGELVPHLEASCTGSPDSTLLVDLFAEKQPFGQFTVGLEKASESLDSTFAADLFDGTQSLGQFTGGKEEASKSLGSSYSMSVASNGNLLRPPEPDAKSQLANGSRGRKGYQRDDGDDIEDQRSYKQSALSLPELEQSEMFDEVLLCKGDDVVPVSCSYNGKLPQKGQSKGSKRGNRRDNRKEVVDLMTLLMQCAQAVGSFNQRTASELLKQIREHSDQFGDGMQRMAFYFANALEMRLTGSAAPVYSMILCIRTSAAEILKAYQVYVQACPFKKMSNFFANKTIAKLSEKATRLHIIDFGILYGFQWPCLIQRLSSRPGGPPKLRITGIELPQPGFRPAERVQETGHRLKRYCERFNVPFEFSFIAKKWETIQLEELKIDRDEMTVVNCLYRLKNIPDDTVVGNSPRDTVLKLIKSINPDLFVNGVVNGTYNVPFFVTRFREALFHFSALFDMFESTIPRDVEQRMLFEREVFNRDAMNVIACEGTERVERPETYRQWQARQRRIGFTQLPLDPEILKNVRTMVKTSYHSDFVVDVDGQWMLQGWKGRIVYALSCWKPVQE